MVTVLERINLGVTRIGSDVKNWQGDFNGANLILQDSSYILSDMSVGIQYIGKSTAISNTDTVRILPLLNTLNNAVDAYANALIEKKRFADSLSLTPQFLYQLQQQKQAAGDLSKSISSKLPTIPWLAAGPVTEQIVSKLDKAIKAFSTTQYIQQPSSIPYNQQPGSPFGSAPYNQQPGFGPAPSPYGQQGGFPAPPTRGWAAEGDSSEE